MVTSNSIFVQKKNIWDQMVFKKWLRLTPSSELLGLEWRDSWLLFYYWLARKWIWRYWLAELLKSVLVHFAKSTLCWGEHGLWSPADWVLIPNFYFLTVWWGASYLTSSWITFLMCKVEITSCRVVTKNELDYFIGVL